MQLLDHLFPFFRKPAPHQSSLTYLAPSPPEQDGVVIMCCFDAHERAARFVIAAADFVKQENLPVARLSC